MAFKPYCRTCNSWHNENEPHVMNLGRQPKPITITLNGDREDVAYWKRELAKRAEFKGDMVSHLSDDRFVIYPRAFND